MKPILFLLFTLYSISFSQDMRKISGHVLDFDTNEPLIGATISVKDKNISTSANLDGEFTLLIPKDSCIVKFEYVGFKPKLFFVYDNIITFDTIRLKSPAPNIHGYPMDTEEQMWQKIENSRNGMQKAQGDIKIGVVKLLLANRITKVEKFIFDKYEIVIEDASKIQSEYRTAYNRIVLKHLKEKYGYKFSNDLEYINWENE